MRTSRSSSRWSGDRRRSVWARPCEMRPSSVAPPVATTIPSPRPPTTAVPAKAIDRRSAIAASTGSGSIEVGSGTDSPVRTLRSTRSASLRQTRRSAGTMSPVRSSTTSPGTRSAARMSPGAPARRTRAVGAVASRSEASARSDR
jgi:hypothetical protein